MKENTVEKNIYFLSDVHLGASVLNDNREREIRLVEWLDYIRPDCSVLFLLGDIFDFWFEYKRVIPKGFTRFLGKIAEFTDSGIPVHFFTGNHDIWAFDYLQKECGMIVHDHNEQFCFNGKKFYIGHGDGLNPNDKGYLFIKRIFRNRFLQKCFSWVHPDLGIKLAHKWSGHSRKSGNKEEQSFQEQENYEIIQFCRRILSIEHIDYFIFGHRHTPVDIELTADSHYINTGDWITHFSYAVFDGEKVRLFIPNK